MPKIVISLAFILCFAVPDAKAYEGLGDIHDEKYFCSGAGSKNGHQGSIL
jgi:hypothetical protein